MNARPTPAPARRIPPLDWLMLALALVSIGLLSWETWGTVSEQQRRWILNADYLICGIFAVEFLYRWRAQGWTRGFVARNWYEILGMIPVAHPAIRGFRLFRVVRIVILLARFGGAADRAFGDEFTYRLVNRFTGSIVEAVKRPITVAVLEEVAAVLGKGHYTRNVARALEENQRELRQMIQEKLREDPQAGRLSRLPFYNDIVESVVDASLRVAEQVLHDPRTDELVADILRENLEQLRAAVRQRQVAEAGLRTRS
jgi:voltage-gated potassium channel